MLDNVSQNHKYRTDQLFRVFSLTLAWRSIYTALELLKDRMLDLAVLQKLCAWRASDSPPPSLNEYLLPSRRLLPPSPPPDVPRPQEACHVHLARPRTGQYSAPSRLMSPPHLHLQQPPPSLREILGAYRSKGDGDRDMLIAMLNAKSAEDQVGVVLPLDSLHRAHA